MTEILRGIGVVGKFVEYFGEGLRGLPLADRATIANMSPEYGATCGFFPVDDETLRYLRLTGRSEQRVALVEAYCKENLLWHDPGRARDVLAGRRARPRRRRAVARRPAAPAGQDRACATRGRAFAEALPGFGVDYGNAIDAGLADTFPASDPRCAAPSREQQRARRGRRSVGAARGRRHAARRRAATSTARPSSSTTAPSSSPRSPRARTPRTRP